MKSFQSGANLKDFPLLNGLLRSVTNYLKGLYLFGAETTEFEVCPPSDGTPLVISPMQNFRQLTEEIYGLEELVYTKLKSSHGCDQEKVSDISKSRSWNLKFTLSKFDKNSIICLFITNIVY